MMGKLLLHSILLNYFTSKIFHFFPQQIKAKKRQEVGGGQYNFHFQERVSL